MDLYIWLTVKQYWLAKNNREAYTFTWDMIASSFTTIELETSQDLASFRRNIKSAIADIVAVWSEVGIEASTDGVTMTRATTSVPQKLPRQELD